MYIKKGVIFFFLFIFLSFFVFFVNQSRYCLNFLKISHKEVVWANDYSKDSSVADDRIKTESGFMEAGYKAIPVTQIPPGLYEDIYEPDNDPNMILCEIENHIPLHRLYPFSVERKYTFYNSDSIINPVYEDRDWAYFYCDCNVSPNLPYEIYAQDISDGNHKIMLKLYDSTKSLLIDSNNQKLSYTCSSTGNGYYLIEASPDPSSEEVGIEYLLGLTIRRYAPYPTVVPLLIEVIDNPDVFIHDIKVRYDTSTSPWYLPDIFQNSYPEIFYYYKFNYLSQNAWVIIEINMDGQTISRQKRLNQYTLNFISIDLTQAKKLRPFSFDPSIVYRTYCDSNDIFNGRLDDMKKIYTMKIADILQYDIQYQCPLPFGDMDNDFPLGGDFDGDNICNGDEVLFYFTEPHKATIEINLNPEAHLFYFPDFHYWPEPGLESEYLSNIFYYDTDSNKWKKSVYCGSIKSIKPNSFNAIYVYNPVKIYPNLNSFTLPVLNLKGFIEPNIFLQTDADFLSIADTGLFDPNHFKQNASALEILSIPELKNIGMICRYNSEKELWEKSYSFFGRGAGEDIRFKSYEVYNILKKKLGKEGGSFNEIYQF